MPYDIPPENNTNLNEREASYPATGKGRIRFFSSFQEQEDEMITYWASITPYKDYSTVTK